MKYHIKLIILDAYGILLSKGYPDTIDALARRFGYDREKLFNVIYRKYFNLAAARKITQKQAWQQSVKELKLSISWQELRDLHLGLMKINWPVLHLCQRLRKHCLVVMLSKNTRSQFSFVRKNFKVLWMQLDDVINTWEYSLPKASRQTIQFLCQRFGVKPDEILFADDQLDNLVEPKKAGVKIIYYKNFGQFKKELQRYIQL